MRRQRYCRDLLFRTRSELTHTATHAAIGVPVKIRPDLLHVSPRISKVGLVNFKTTSARDYNCQAYFYTDVLGATRFTIIGVQKRAPTPSGRSSYSTFPTSSSRGARSTSD